jgi:predicted acylesterase/phospholipase RssA
MTGLRHKIFEKVRELTDKFEPEFLVRKPSRRSAQPALVPGLRIGLSLSGGGFRATFYHLGAIRLLQQLDLLEQVTGVYSVSGGSILAGHLAKNWTSYAQRDQSVSSFLEASKPLFAIAQEDLRGRIVRRWLASLGLRSTSWIPRFIEAYYQKIGELSGELKDLPSRPTFAFLATSMRNGRAVSFSQQGFHDGTHFHGCAHWPIARAVAASSAFPPVFPTIPVANRDLVSTNHDDRGVEHLTDGGVYDNLGLSRLMQDAGIRADERWCELILVSDASAPFESSLSDKFKFMLTRGLRTTDILMKRVAELEAAESATDVGTEDKVCRPFLIRAAIDSVVPEKNSLPSKVECASFVLQDDKVQNLMAGIRTDLDVFSTLEIAALMRHGYEVMLDALMKAKYVPQDFVPADPCGQVFPSLKGFSEVARVKSPLGEMPDKKAVRDALERGSKRRLRIFNPSDWVSWLLLVEVLLALLICYVIIRHFI